MTFGAGEFIKVQEIGDGLTSLNYTLNLTSLQENCTGPKGKMFIKSR